MIEKFYDISPRLLELDRQARGLCAGQFAALEEIKEYNQLKMLRAFTDCGPAATSWSRYLQRRWGPKRPCSARVFSLARTR